MQELDSTDSAILNRIQSDFPITSRPYLTVANELGLSEEEVLDRVARLKADGIIRRIGGNLVPGKLGFVSTLCAASVPADKIDHFAEIVNRYQRDSTYNVWFTFIASSKDDIKKNLKQIAKDSGIDDILNLPATKVFKIRAEFEV
jgi:DNA-binding Lrp family transcriptional regulator